MHDFPADRCYGDYCFYIEKVGANLPETLAMWQDHWNEQGEDELRGVEFNPDVEQFKHNEARHCFVYLTVRCNAELVGHFGIWFGINRQTSKPVAGDDFFYLKPEHRKGMLAIKLIKFAKELAFHLGATEFGCSYRVTGDPRMAAILKRCGLAPIANVFSARR